MTKAATRFKGLRQRLFLSYSALLLVFVLLFAAVLLVLITSNSIDSSLKNQAELTGNTISQIDSFLAEMDMVASSAASNPQLLTYFISISEETEPVNYFSRNIMDYVDVSSLLANINGPKNIVDRMSVYNERGDYISAGILLENGDIIRGQLRNGRDIFNEFGHETPAISGPHDDYWSRLPNKIISVFRPLGNPYSNRVYGTVEAQRDFTRLEAQLAQESLKDFQVFVLEPDGKRVYASSGAKASLLEYADYFAAPYKGGIETISRGDEYITLGKSGISNWTVALVQSRSLMLKPYSSTFTVLIAGAIALSILLCTAVYVVADRLSYPLRALSTSIRQADLRNFALDLPDADSDEIQAIYSAFNTLFARLNEAAALELRTRMLALQSQTNPHFLYNIFSVISAQAMEDGSEAVVKMCDGVSALFRYAASHSEPDVTLLDELNHTKVYLELMKIRYEEDFNFVIEATPRAAEIKVPKFILQPLVENCFYHGFKNSSMPWKISITALLTEKEWLVRVTDNGSGMTDEAVIDFFKHFDEYKSKLGYPHLKPGGLGMLNTAIRLLLAYGDNHVFKIGRAPEGGSFVEIGGAL